MTRYVTIKRFADSSGYSVKAVQEKIAQGVWTQGKEYRRAPDGRVLIDIQGYEKWSEK